MLNGIRKLIFASLVLMVGSYCYAGDTFRCRDGQIVSVGDTLAEVYVKCGEPTFRDQRVESSRWGVGTWGHREVVTIEDWTYNMGANEFMYRLVFANGRLATVESLGHGFNVYEQDGMPR